MATPKPCNTSSDPNPIDHNDNLIITEHAKHDKYVKQRKQLSSNKSRQGTLQIRQDNNLYPAIQILAEINIINRIKSLKISLSSHKVLINSCN